MTPDTILHRLLAFLEDRIDLDHVRSLADRHRRALLYQDVDRLPLVLYVPYRGTDFAPYTVSEALDDPAKMMVNQLLKGFSSIYHLVDLRTDTPLCLRPDMGVTIIASMFGAAIEVRGNEPPWVQPLGGRDAIRRILDDAAPALDSGLVPRVLAQYAFFRAALDGYPRCEAAMQLTLPDLQGPFDIAELLWGSDIFLALYDEPELVSAFLARISDTILAVYRRLRDDVREDLGAGCQYQHATGVRGALLLRGDSSVIMLSPKMYAEHVLPHDVRLAREPGGVGVHFCGDGTHQIPTLRGMPGLETIDFGQSFMMDIDAIYAGARVQHIALTRVQLPDAELNAGRLRERFPTGVNLLREVGSVDEARQVWARYIGPANSGA